MEMMFTLRLQTNFFACTNGRFIFCNIHVDVLSLLERRVHDMYRKGRGKKCFSNFVGKVPGNTFWKNTKLQLDNVAYEGVS